MNRVVARLRRDDAGLSLVEVLVATALMAVVLVIFTSGVLAVHRTTRRGEEIATAQAGLSRAFARLDSELRYAQKVWPRHIDGLETDALEYLSDVGGARWCYRLWVADGGLYRRTWSDPQDPPSYPSPRPDSGARRIADGVAPLPAPAGTTAPDDPPESAVQEVFRMDDGTSTGARAVTVTLADLRGERELRQEFPLPNTVDSPAATLTTDDCEDWMEELP